MAWTPPPFPRTTAAGGGGCLGRVLNLDAAETLATTVLGGNGAGAGLGGGGGAGGCSEGRGGPDEELLGAGGLGEPGARKREGGDPDGGECPREERRGGLGFGGLRARRREGFAEVDGLSVFGGGCLASPESSASSRNSSPRVRLDPVAGRRAGFSSSKQRASSDSGQNSRTEVSSHRTPELVGQGSRRWWWKTKSSGAAA